MTTRFLRVGHILLCVVWLDPINALSAVAARRQRTTFFGLGSPGPLVPSPSSWSMRDSSASYWFQVNDRVRVVEDVWKSDVNLRNREGIVIQTWEKCDVDPTCCCAEQVDVGMAVHVQFFNATSENIAAPMSVASTSAINEIPLFTHYFAESELWKVVET